MALRLDDLIAIINGKRWLVASLYQKAPDDWHASLRYWNSFTSAHGEGETALEAMERAWVKAAVPTTDKDWEEFRPKPRSAPAPAQPSAKVERVRIKSKVERFRIKE